MKCPFCDFMDTQVKDSRPSDDSESIKRRRWCQCCGAKFKTIERREVGEIKVVKRSGAKRLFDGKKLLQSLVIATRKRPISTEQLESIVSNLINSIERFSEGEVTSMHIGQLAMNELAKIDQVSYVRYASVYKEFNTVGDFGEFIKTMAKKNVS